MIEQEQNGTQPLHSAVLILLLPSAGTKGRRCLREGKGRIHLSEVWLETGVAITFLRSKKLHIFKLHNLICFDIRKSPPQSISPQSSPVLLTIPPSSPHLLPGKRYFVVVVLLSLPISSHFLEFGTKMEQNDTV